MAVILIWMSPEPGHVLPTIKIARDLIRRGHTVIYQTRSQVREELEDLGLKTIGFFESVSADETTCLFQPTNSAGWQYVAIFQGHPRSKHRDLLRAEILRGALSTGADLLLLDGTFERLFALDMHRLLPGKCKVAHIHTHLPYSPFRPDDLAAERGPIIFLVPAEFELEESILPGAVYAEGSAFAGTGSGDLPCFDPGRPLIYCSFGSQIDRYALVEATLKKIGGAAAMLPDYQFIVNAGLMAGEFKALERQNLQVCRQVPQVRLLPKCSAMILHGGLGSVKDCIHQKVPMLVLPQRWDQPSNGMRVRRHGLGLSLDLLEASSMSIATALVSLLTDGSFIANLTAMRKIFVERDHQEIAANTCVRLLGGEAAACAESPLSNALVAPN